MYYKFSANRISGDGNVVFPDQLIIDDEGVTYQRQKVIGCTQTKIRYESISSVTIDKHLIFADVTIETNGGMKVSAFGFSKRDAKMILSIIQSRL